MTVVLTCNVDNKNKIDYGDKMSHINMKFA